VERKRTRQITVGDVAIGGGAPISIQSMVSGFTHDIDACVSEINRLSEAGADIVRVAVPQKTDTEALPEILNQTHVPIVADHKIRLNPGNIDDEAQVLDVIDACKGSGIPIRVGVNEGSVVERKDKKKRQVELASFFADRHQGHLLAMMIAKLEEYMEVFEQRDFYDVCISAKLMDASLVIDIYREISERFEYPLHVGVTHAGPRETGAIRSITALGSLLSSGIGDTIRISYASDPVFEVEDAVELLNCLHLRDRVGAELIACPSCGRIQVDLYSLVEDVRMQLANDIELPIKVAVMGCVVNGPGEAEGADVAVFAGDRRGIIYVQGERVANVHEDEILPRLLDECRSLQDRVRSGATKLGEKAVSIVPPPELTVEGESH